MDDAQIHGSIEQLVAEEHELWSERRPGMLPMSTGGGSRSSRFPSTSAGICSASVERFARRAGPEGAQARRPEVVEDYEQ